MADLSDFLNQLDALVSANNDELSQARREDVVRAALERYSHDRPDTQTDDVTGDGGRYYAITTELASWIEEFSRIRSIEYPAAVIASDELPQYLEDEDWQDDYWADVSGTQTRHLLLPNHSPAATETMRITYTVPWTLSGAPEAVSTPAQDFYAICYAAACIYCQQVAAKYARIGDSTISADSASHTTKSQEFKNRAVDFCKTYEQMMGIGKGITGAEAGAEEAPAGTFVNWDTAPGWPVGRDYIFHRSR
jgi:hypothetical protein